MSEHVYDRHQDALKAFDAATRELGIVVMNAREIANRLQAHLESVAKGPQKEHLTELGGIIASSNDRPMLKAVHVDDWPSRQVIDAALAKAHQARIALRQAKEALDKHNAGRQQG